jgi:Bacterial sugar transferase
MSVTAPCAHASMGTDRRSILSGGYRLQQRRWRIYKRILDIACSSFLILALLFLMAAIAAAIKFDSKGPVIFRQRRRGCGGGYFMCYKFRTMHAKFTDSEARVQSRRNDERITKVGSFLSQDQPRRIAPIIQCAAGRHVLGRAAPACSGHQRGWLPVAGYRRELLVTIFREAGDHRLSASARIARHSWHERRTKLAVEF